MVERYEYNVDKMYTYLRGFLVGANMEESLKALQLMRQKHEGQTRKNGVPYIVHPLSMACYATALKIKSDSMIATILLHDVVEDCNVELESLQFSDAVKNGIKYMTVTKLSPTEDKVTTKRRYYAELLNSKEAVVCKAIDRYNNLTDMPFALSEEAIGKNVAETEIMLLPVLKQAKEKWTDLADLMFILRTNIRGINDNLKLHYTDQYEKYYKIYTKEA